MNIEDIISSGLGSIEETTAEEELWKDMASPANQLIDDFIAMRSVTEAEARALFASELADLCNKFGIGQDSLKEMISVGLGITTLRDLREMDLCHIKAMSPVQRRAVVYWAHGFVKKYQIQFVPFQTPFVFDNEFDRIIKELKISDDAKMCILRSGICMSGMASMQEMDLLEILCPIDSAQRRAFVRWAHSVAQFMAGRVPACSMIR